MTALSDFVTAAEALVTGAATFEALADTVQSTAATAKVQIGDDLKGLILRAEQAEQQANLLSAKGNASSDARPHWYLSDTFPVDGT